jgi:pimeloyl-ACP methyl ester carboxylesterase
MTENRHLLTRHAARSIQEAYNEMENRKFLTLALAGAQLIQRVYNEPGQLGQVGEWTLTDFLQDGGVQVYLAQSSTEPLRAVVIPGSNEPADWRSNFDLRRTTVHGLPGEWRHGFIDGARKAWQLVLRKDPIRQATIVVGHSYGAALALGFAALAARRGIAPYGTDLPGDRIRPSYIRQVIAFASPRVTNRDGAGYLERYYRELGWRINYGFDFVPWSVLPAGWCHPFEPYFLGSDGAIRRRQKWGLELRRALRRRGLQAWADHGISNYRLWLENELAKGEQTA